MKTFIVETLPFASIITSGINTKIITTIWDFGKLKA